jgi:hypothetical protein
VSGDTNNAPDVFLRDRFQHLTIRVNISADGSQGAFGLSDLFKPLAISRDGHTVVFSTPDALVPEDTNGVDDIYSFHFTGELQAPPAQSPTPTPAVPVVLPPTGGAPGGGDSSPVAPIALALATSGLAIAVWSARRRPDARQ